jgi:hypothetical protein
MSSTPALRSAHADWLTVVAIAAIASSVNTGFHEGVHALTCLAVGGDLREYSALHVLCDTSLSQEKVVAASASLANLLVGTLIWRALPMTRRLRPELQYGLWLFMLLNWLAGAGYWMFSGAANVGDWALVIRGWAPHWLWRALMFILGTPLFVLFVWLALREFGQIVGGTPDEQIGRANRLALLSYGSVTGAIALAGLFHPNGLLSLPVVAGLLAVIGSASPLAWMMQWFRAKRFIKAAKAPLEIQRRWEIIAVAGVVVFIYAVVVGRTLYF